MKIYKYDTLQGENDVLFDRVGTFHEIQCQGCINLEAIKLPTHPMHTGKDAMHCNM